MTAHGHTADLNIILTAASDRGVVWKLKLHFNYCIMHV